MGRLYLRVHAPFAAFRGMQAGVYRATAPTIPPSAAFGLVLNLAGIEMRDPRPNFTTLIRTDLPRLGLAVGSLSLAPPMVGTIYQQLHSYPVGNSGKELREKTHGAKYWIAPARREVLVSFEAMIGVDSSDAELLRRIGAGLVGELDGERYGLPFAGDNNFLFDRIEAMDIPDPAHWYTPVASSGPVRAGSCRLTVGIDRQDSSRTITALLAPQEAATRTPPPEAWFSMPTTSQSLQTPPTPGSVRAAP